MVYSMAYKNALFEELLCHSNDIMILIKWYLLGIISISVKTAKILTSLQFLVSEAIECLPHFYFALRLKINL